MKLFVTLSFPLAILKDGACGCSCAVAMGTLECGQQAGKCRQTPSPNVALQSRSVLQGQCCSFFTDTQIPYLPDAPTSAGIFSSSGFIMQQPRLSTIVLCLRAVKSKRCVINPAVPQDHMKTQPCCCDAQRGGWSMVPTLSEHGLFGSVAAGRCWSHHADWGRIQAFIRHLRKCGNCESVGFGQGH